MTWYSGAPNCAKSLMKAWMPAPGSLHITLISCSPPFVPLMGSFHHEPTH
jgi:hypothetical protein